MKIGKLFGMQLDIKDQKRKTRFDILKIKFKFLANWWSRQFRDSCDKAATKLELTTETFMQHNISRDCEFYLML